jgi:dCMP deaminase
MDIKWKKRFLKMANDVSSWSKDESTKVGSVITTEDRAPVSFGYNGFPPGVNDNDEAKHQRPEKYFYFTHSEINAILQADRQQLKDSVLFVTHYPCADCTKAIIKSGIKEVVYIKENGVDGPLKDRFKDNFAASTSMFNEVGTILTPISIEDL